VHVLTLCFIQVLNGLLEPSHTCYVLGRVVNRPASLDAGLQEELWNARVSSPIVSLLLGVF
jgi:hypothetical protein